MTLRAWFLPKLNSDLKESLRDKQLLGNWPLREAPEIAGKKIYLCKADLSLPDGSSLRLSATYDPTPPKSKVSLSVFAGGNPIFNTYGIGATALSAIAATGKGGFLEIHIYPNHDP